jgi:hypothetical protein
MQAPQSVSQQHTDGVETTGRRIATENNAGSATPSTAQTTQPAIQMVQPGFPAGLEAWVPGSIRIDPRSLLGWRAERKGKGMHGGRTALLGWRAERKGKGMHGGRARPG